VLDEGKPFRFIDALERNGCRVHEIPHLSAFRYEPTRHISILAKVLPLKLHKSRSLLKNTVLNDAHQMVRYTDCLFFGYGICGTGETNSVFAGEFKKPVFMLNRADNPADDCIGCLLGGRKRYYAEQCKNPGTFYITPGWTTHWRSMLEGCTDTSSQQAIVHMFHKYKRILLVRTPVMSETEMINNIAELVQLLKLPVEVQDGTFELLMNSWASLKEALKIAPIS
jgi:hypothetical protein